MTQVKNLKVKRSGSHWSWGQQGGSRAQPISRPSKRATRGATVAVSTSRSNPNLSNLELNLQQISKQFGEQLKGSARGSAASCSLPRHLQRMNHIRQFQPEFVLLFHFAQHALGLPANAFRWDAPMLRAESMLEVGIPSF